MIVLLIVLFAAPAFPVPTLSSTMQASLTDKAKIRWSKSVEGRIVSLTIAGGEAERIDTGIQPGPARMKYDLKKNHELESAVRSVKLPAQSKREPVDPNDRTLEILAEGPKDWIVVGRWTMPLKTWSKKYSGVTELLEPMFSITPDLFQPTREPPK
jgi:hypothetical protein